MADNETSLKEDLAAAFEAADKASEPAPVEAVVEVSAPVDPIGESAEAKEARVRDEKGRFTAKVGDKDPEPPKVAEAPKAEVKPPPPAEPAPIVEPEKPKARPPASWKPTAREGWDKVPQDIQAEVIRRERETAMALQESSEARQTYSKFKELTSPYEPMFRAEGVDAMQGIGNLMRATAVLATGAPQAKADLIANLIQRYGVDIATLDARLSGQAQQPQQSAYDPGYIARQAQEAVRRELAQYQQESAKKTAAQQLEAFQATEPEFFADLRDDMSRLLETGFAKDYNDAYSKAQLLNPTVARVIEQRKAAASVSGVQRAQAAASSVRGNPATGIAASVERDRRGDLEDAWNKVHGGNR